MLTMFYTEADPHIYIETAEKIYQYSAFESVKSFDKYFFYMPETVDLSAAYIVDRYMSRSLDRNYFIVTDYDFYSVAVPK